MSNKRVVFPFAEAGMGHIIPMRGIADAFEHNYGDRVDCLRSRFFTESGNESLKAFEERMCNSVERQNKDRSFGFFMTDSMNFWGARISTRSSARYLKSGAFEAAVLHMDELEPDVVISTHWSTNYFACKCNRKPATVLYCPDPRTYPLYNYPCDLFVIPSRIGYAEAIKKYRRRFNKNNALYVPYPIRREAYDVCPDKEALRAKLGIDNRFTALLAEGGYGIGKMSKICRLAIERDLPVNIIAVCSKNEELYKELSAIETVGKCRLIPIGFTNKMLDYIAASDLFCGKSGANIFAEACFFGVPQIATNYSSGVEQLNGEYYVNMVKSALKIFDPEDVVNKISQFADGSSEYDALLYSARSLRSDYGADSCAEIIFNWLLSHGKL